MERTTARVTFAITAVVATAVSVVVAFTSAGAGSVGASAFVPITPCRLFDTRPAPLTIGNRSTPVGPGETITVDAWGTNGDCTLPSGATGLSLNVVAVSPTASSFLTVFPAGNQRPTASSLNWVAGQAPTPNAVTAKLSSSGQVSFYNLSGNVDLAVDVVGYYEEVDAGTSGPDPARVVWVAASGGDFTSISAALASITDAEDSKPYVVRVAPGIYFENDGVVAKDWVDIEGSGASTVISSDGDPVHGAAVVIDGLWHTEVRNLSVWTSGEWGVRVTDTPGDAHVRLVDVDVTQSTAAAGPSAIWIDSATVTLDSVSTTSTETTPGTVGIEIDGSDVTIIDAAATVTGQSMSGRCTAVDVDTSNVRIDGLVARSSGCSDARAVAMNSSTVVADRVRATVSGLAGSPSEAVWITNSIATLDRLEADSTAPVTVGAGMYVFSSTVLIRDSNLDGESDSMRVVSSTMRMIDTIVGAPTMGMTGRCTDVFSAGTLDSYICA